MRFVCLFVCVFFVPLEDFSFIWRHTVAGEGLHILTYARHSWTLSSEGSLACHTYCDIGAFVYDDHLRGPVILTPVAERLNLNDVGLSRLEFENPTFRLRGECSRFLLTRVTVGLAR